MSQRLSGRVGTGQRRGVVLVLVAICLVVLAGMLALVIDVGRAANTQRELQASSDAAATAGAQSLPDSAVAMSVAREYSSLSGKKNARSDLPGVSMTSVAGCVDATGLPCAPVNAVVVKQQVVIPSFFAWILGMKTMTISATSTATMKGGTPSAMDVYVIIDVSASMADNCTATTGVSSPKRVDCAKAGMRAFLGEVWPCSPDRSNCGAVINGNVTNPLDKVGLMMFPGVASAAAVAKEWNCKKDIIDSDVADYDENPIYEVVPLSSDYRTSSKSSLNGAVSNLVKAVDWGDGNGCTPAGYGSSSGYGMESLGGVSTHFAPALLQAQAALVNKGRKDVQKVIILLSDGDANVGIAPCQAAINAANAATSAGTWVYAIAYGASGGGCKNDKKLTDRLTMQRIASDPGKFFDQPSAADLSAIFKKIASQLSTTRLVNNNLIK